ncbi:uncharacterized protein TNCV_2055811 [Trichonephila clavipes]|nr:uncharacterized protein TNCV_2055811 [Trichonephila clavipes]
MDILKLNKAKTSLKGSITRIATFMDNVSEHVDITELEVKLKKIDQLQRKIEELKELLFGLETANPTEEAEFEEDLYKCETRLDDLEVRVKKLINSINVSLSVTAVEKNRYENGTFAQTKIPPIILPTFSGKYEQFSNFKSQFDDLIATSEQLTQSQKLYYLNSCLSNEVKEFASTFDTFSSLYEALESRYDSKRLIVDIHVQQILNFKKIELLTNPEDRESNVVDSSTQNTVLSSTASQHRKNVLISTGSVFLRNNEGRELKCPVIFDSASNINIISRKMCDFLGIAIEKINSSVSGLNSLKQNLKGKTNTLISNKSGTFRENVEFFVTEKITGLTPSVTLDVSEIKIPEFLELSDPYFYEAKEIHALLNADIFFRIIKDNVYKVNKELLFRETEFGWIAGGRLQGTNTNNFSCYFLKDNDSVDDTLKLFFELESLGIKDDPCYRKDDQAMNIFKETVQYNNNRYVVELPFRKHWNELSNNISVAKQRFQSLWGRLRRDKTLYTQYKETIQDYLNQGIIEKVNDTEINVHKPMYYLPHQAIKKEGRVTISTRIVFDAASHQANELSLNDCLWPGPNLNPNLLDVLINFRLNQVAISSDIRQAFLQICLADKHKDFVRFLWTDSNPRIGEKLTLQVYRFNRVIFGVNSSPFLLAATIKYHIEKYNEIHPITVQHLDSFMYVDD